MTVDLTVSPNSGAEKTLHLPKAGDATVLCLISFSSGTSPARDSALLDRFCSEIIQRLFNDLHGSSRTLSLI